MKTIEFMAGTHVSQAAAELVAAAETHGAAKGAFNGLEMVANKGQPASEVCADFTRRQDEAAEAYRRSPAGIKAAQEADQRRSNAQQKHDALMKRLPSLNFRDDAAVLDWLCEMQDPSDHIDVIVRSKTIVETFAKHGFKPGVNCGGDFKAEDRDNVFRWIVGQALDGLEKVAIHGVIHKFAGDWKAKFLKSAAA